ncbi:MAG TPA: hypothetical protein VFN76_03025, partial [Candidatus Limnocylindria bacterium]|nr:hypothetical protein [Candidatus Limnocylindria bacterium]
MESRRRRWLTVIVVAGIALGVLSLFNAWVVHDRKVLGEGYREVVSTLGAWDVLVTPALTAGLVAALLTAVAAAAILATGRRLPSRALLAGAALALGLVAASLVPLSQAGQASRVDLSPAWALIAGTALAAVMVAAASVADPPGRRGMLMAGALFAAVAVVGIGSQWLVLQARGGSNEAWSPGSYTREAAGEPELTLTIGDGTYAIGDRWAGTWESRGWIVSLDDDPACPGSRGTYHAHGYPEPLDSDLRFVKVVDTCEDGARAEALES